MRKTLLQESPLSSKICSKLSTLDIQLWSALIIGAAAIAVLTVVVASLGKGPPPVQAGSRKGDKAEIAKDIGPRVIPIQRIKPEPELRTEVTPAWLQTPLPVKSVDVRPTNPLSSKPVAKPDRAEQICARHNMRKVWVNSRKWRCRK